MQYLLDNCQETPAGFLKKNEAEQRDTIQKMIQIQRSKYTLRPEDRRLTHEEMQKAAADWVKRGRITGGEYDWVESRHVLAAASDKDLELLLDVRAHVMQRISDECLYEVSILDDLIKRLGRSRYRKEVGLTENVGNETL